MKVTIFNSEISAEINSKGAELIQLSKNNKNFIWTIDEMYWNKTSPILFPIVGALKNDTYFYNEKQYHLPRHGFARNFDFKIDKQLDHQVIFLLEENENTKQNYPFNFKLYLAYTLQGSTLVIEYFIRNESNEILPFSVGAHPAFAINDSFNNYTLHFNEPEKLEKHLLKNNCFSGETALVESNNGVVNLNYSLFTQDALVFKNLKSDSVLVKHLNQPYFKITFDNFPYLGIWAKENAPFLCIEPWCGLADYESHNQQLSEKEGIVLLPPNEDFLRAIHIDLY